MEISYIGLWLVVQPLFHHMKNPELCSIIFFSNSKINSNIIIKIYARNKDKYICCMSTIF